MDPDAPAAQLVAVEDQVVGLGAGPPRIGLQHRDVLVAVGAPPSAGDRERVVRVPERDHVAERALVARADVPDGVAHGGAEHVGGGDHGQGDRCPSQ